MTKDCTPSLQLNNSNSVVGQKDSDLQGYSARRLNFLANAVNATRYLEIGVETGSTFKDVSCSSKTGVDPCFLFDWETCNGTNGVKLLNTTSDLFFHDLDPGTVFDLIFIDGLHTFEQTYRDIIHAVSHSHARTIFLIDDTVPCDVFSTCRNQDQCLNLRASLYGPGDPRWHGDTYKILPLLSVFNPEYEVATIIDNGNPQTLLWRPQVESASADQQFRAMQAMWAIQNLAAADYLWFLDNLALYNPLSEQEALEKVLNTLIQC
jgi:hypothetical protein